MPALIKIVGDTPDIEPKIPEDESEDTSSVPGQEKLQVCKIRVSLFSEL
jgi:hypothetical protein